MRFANHVITLSIVLCIGSLFSATIENPFSQKTLEIGPMVSYVHYDEIFSVKDVEEIIGLDSTIGWPKSTEYGAQLGIRVSYRHLGKTIPLYFNPRISYQLFPKNQYDGTTQGQAI